MKITVINGTEKKGVTYRLKEVFLEPFRGEAEIKEFYLPKDGPGFCVGCTTCFRDDEAQCKDAEKGSEDRRLCWRRIFWYLLRLRMCST